MTDKINLDELPPELVKELDLTNRYTKPTYIVELLEYGPLDINQILIGIYKKYGIITSRSSISNCLCYLKKTGRIFKVPGKRGFYSLKKPVKND